MAVIKRGVGVSSTEKSLAALADKYPNLFGSAGEELCDLLVVCGDDVLIFSDKSINWSSGADVKVAWPRWYRKAIGKSTAQINGAARILRDHTDQLFLDAACKERFPLTLLQLTGVASISLRSPSALPKPAQNTAKIRRVILRSILRSRATTISTAGPLASSRLPSATCSPMAALSMSLLSRRSSFLRASSTPSPTSPAT
jgi:hypothetical protein